MTFFDFLAQASLLQWAGLFVLVFLLRNGSALVDCTTSVKSEGGDCTTWNTNGREETK